MTLRWFFTRSSRGNSRPRTHQSHVPIHRSALRGVGELTQAVLTEQFERIRAGDQYWYENLFSGRELRDLQRTTLADVIRRNTEITGLQRNVFFV